MKPRVPATALLLRPDVLDSLHGGGSFYRTQVPVLPYPKTPVEAFGVPHLGPVPQRQAHPRIAPVAVDRPPSWSQDSVSVDNAVPKPAMDDPAPPVIDTSGELTEPFYSAEEIGAATVDVKAHYQDLSSPPEPEPVLDPETVVDPEADFSTGADVSPG